MDIRAMDHHHVGLLNVTSWDPSGDGVGQRAIADILKSMCAGVRNTWGGRVYTVDAVIDNYEYEIDTKNLSKSVSIKKPQEWNFETVTGGADDPRRLIKIGDQMIGYSQSVYSECDDSDGPIINHYASKPRAADDLVKLPDFSSFGSCQSIMGGAEFAEIADDVNAIEGQIFRIIVKSEIQKMLIETHGTPGEFSGEYDAQVRGADHKSTFSAEWLAPVLKALKRMKEVKFSMGTDVPCKVSARVGGGELEYYLAPWIESNGPECDE